ncbi:DUF1684 domain-containing protein [Rathayibacter iranicus]|uniref:DUF1684 domain-containing protein n=2 Tax=Rathayibacter iranicus TaxID=59737 RepID=A0AAD1AD85_9MICO|nr:DUF1684 domain-containing protein [Rathayibacter iranicus]AZZ56108.1 DUF1684 domain-containing protein [Rathayibacter iranicus]MWV30200.1 DUF1684 domain-containing protein [Rathayibacter iranicus NCPPB 2253 = VKM Ac-1602]PPI46176.1 hypothetical protein C5E09_08595 [Rathayibacter iranicus]PPI59550.1 hypothetical protein C5E08_09515 [Rathayibacter iranicus]PPI71028.1 hypothetical protein C5E01_08560 [Rathayibacter iranicus]
MSPDGTEEISRSELLHLHWPSAGEDEQDTGIASPSRTLASAIEVTDWRRRTQALYAEVRRLSNVDLLAAHASWIRGRNALFAQHPATPLLPGDRAHFRSLPIAPYDAAWRFELAIAPAEEARQMEVETGTDGTVPFELVGTVEVPHVGSLDVWRLASYGGGLFLPVKDALAGTPGGTYGGGRYLLDTIKGADLGPGAAPGTLVLDFNFAYNPSCAYDPAWACPLAPAGNTLAVEVPVGERYRG